MLFYDGLSEEMMDDVGGRLGKTIFLFEGIRGV